MSLKESAEMYLETIYTLSMTHSYVRSIDVAEALGYSRSSVSRAVDLLTKDGYLSVKEEGFLILTEKGMEAAEKIYERHTILTAALVALGVDPETAAEDACKIEHDISDRTLDAIKAHMKTSLSYYNTSAASYFRPLFFTVFPSPHIPHVQYLL